MREFNTKGLTRESLDQVYEIVLLQKIALEQKLERVKKECAVTACMIDDGNKIDVEQVSHGLKNFIAYIEAKIPAVEELNIDKGTIELINEHLEQIKEYEISRLAEAPKIKKCFMVYTDSDFAKTKSNIFVSNRKYLTEKQFYAENKKTKSWKVIGIVLNKEDFNVENFI